MTLQPGLHPREGSPGAPQGRARTSGSILWFCLILPDEGTASAQAELGECAQGSAPSSLPGHGALPSVSEN